MHHHYQIKMHHQPHQVEALQHLHQDLRMEPPHHNMVVIRHITEVLDRRIRPDHRIRVIPDSHHYIRIITLHSMVIRAIRAGLVDIQDSLNILANTTLNSTVITDNQGTPDIMDIKIMVITVTMAKRTKTKVQ